MSSSPDPFHDPSASMADDSAAPKKSRRGCFLGCLIFSGIVVLVCCGGGYWLMTFVSDQLGSEVQRRVADNPIVQEQIGEVQSVQFELMETARQSQSAQEDGKPGVLVFSIEGSTGSGQIIVRQDDANQPDFDSITLVTSEGDQIPLGPSGGSDPDSIESEMGDIDSELNIDTGELDSSESRSGGASIDTESSDSSGSIETSETGQTVP